MIAELLLTIGIGCHAVVADVMPDYMPIGECRITTYCPSCNDGTGHESSSGTYLEYGHAACRWLPIGTVIDIEGERFEVVDICGTDAIDLYVETNECRCNLNEYRRVSIVRNGAETK